MVKIAILVLPETELLDLAGPVQVFDAANGLGADYVLSFVGIVPHVRSAQGLELLVSPELPPVTGDDLVLIPGVRRGSLNANADSRLLAWLRGAAEAEARIAAVCTGTFLLGEAGLLDGRRCTTHWALVAALAARFPGATVADAALFVQDSGVTTSAGIASGIDMALWLVEQDHGPLVAARVARELVVYLRRDGGHEQSSIYLEYRTHLHPRVDRAQDWLIENFTTKVTLDQLADVVGTSARHLARGFKSATGLTPLGYQQHLRLEFAATLMQDPRLSLEAIADRCGFDDACSLRRLWRERYGQAPSCMRKKRTEGRRFGA